MGLARDADHARAVLTGRNAGREGGDGFLERVLVAPGDAHAVAAGDERFRDSALLTLAPGEAAPPFLLYLGRFDIYMKGLDRLVSAFASLPTEVRGSLRLVLAGAASPQALAAVERLAAKAPGVPIELVPNVPEDRKRELLRTCLFFVSPSRFEGWGIAALEANAAGKAVLATQADGFRDSLKDGFAAVLVPVDDEAALRAALRGLIEDEAWRRRLAGNAREWAARFSWDGVAAREREWLEANLGH